MLLEYVSFLDFGRVKNSSHISNRQTCENFAQLAKRGYYNGVIFHRIVVVRPPYPKLSYLCSSSFEGFYGPGRRPDWDGQRRHQHIRSKVVRRTFSSVAHRTNDLPIHSSEDEIHPELRFTGAGILAMANSGPNTNGPSRLVSSHFVPTQLPRPRTTKRSLHARDFGSLGSQFFMTLAPTPFLDNKHTIFGRVISGMRVLQRLGAVGVDAQDRSVYTPLFFFFFGASSSVSTELTVFKTGHVKKSRFTKLEWNNSKFFSQTGSNTSHSYSFTQHVAKRCPATPVVLIMARHPCLSKYIAWRQNVTATHNYIDITYL